VRTWKECNRLLPHAIATTDLAEPLAIGLEAVARLLNQIAMYAFGRAEYSNARAAFERALKIDEKAFGPDLPNVARDVWWLGTLLRELGDLPGAKAAFERALQIFQKSLGDDHPMTRLVRGNIDSLSP
jgi:tetratricopeptide (TPR) repeat protein